jgi:methionyl-tRNA synthetase
MFLPDRFVKGICPKCGAHEQFGDGCDKCGSTYSTKELKSPQCSLCGSQPVEKQTTHLFFKLNHYKEELKSWVKKHTAPEVANKLLNEWLQEDLKDWDITRDSPYFGFEVPELDNKFFYVWVDAPICYLSTALEWAEENQMDPMVMWNGDDVKIHHFIGKDIIYFHALYWPAMLMAADYKLPHQLHVHGMLQVNGEKMSKTKGTFINARVFRDHFSPELLRYYYASKLTSHATDLDLNLDDFINRINAELVGKITNLFSRGAQMLNKKLDGVIGEMDVDGKRLINKALESAESIEENFDKGDFSKAIQEIRSLAEEGNRYFDEKEPWKLIKNDEEEARRVLSSTLNLCRILAIYLKPVLPNYVEQVEELLNVEALNWKERDQVLQDHSIGEFKPLASRIEKTQVEKMLEEQKQLLQF